MKRSSTRFLYIIINLLAAVLYSVILFSVKKNFVIISWVAYAFTIVSFLTVAVTCYLPDFGTKRNVLFGIPESIITFIYFILQLFGGIWIMLNNQLKPQIVIVAEIALFLVYLIASCTIHLGGTITESQERYENTKIATLRMMKMNLNVIKEETQDLELRKRIALLAEAIEYSDPMSSEQLSDLENRINHNIELLREEVDTGDTDRALQRVERIQKLMNERNEKCTLLKQRK